MERPEKILVLSSGSRGDVQPYIAVVKALQAVGYKDVLLGTNVNHETLVKECGVPFFGMYGDAEKYMKDSEAVMASMAEGSTLKFVQGLSEAAEHFAEMHATLLNQVMKEFQPDLTISGSLVEAHGFLSLLHFKVPAIFALPAHMPPNPKRMVLGLPNLPFGLNAWVVRDVLMEGVWNGQKKADNKAFHIAGYKLSDMINKQVLLDEANCPDMVPRLTMMNTGWFDVMYPGSDPGVQSVGSSTLSADFQVEVGSSDSPTGFGSAAGLEKVRAFLAAGDKPIFMGWGSMTCKSEEYMVELVTRAAKLAGCRAIIQAGWAHLSFEVLKSSTKDQGLIEYAKKSVCFIEGAPHEWLFPQCACIVHHGGSGTTAATMRAGKPCIITPVFLDQFDHSYLVRQLGVGVGFKKQFQRISAKELADAIQKCITSDDIHAKAEEMGLAMRKQDGARGVAEYVDVFWAKEVRTGQQLDKAQKLLEKLKAPKKRCSDNCGCLPRPQTKPQK